METFLSAVGTVAIIAGAYTAVLAAAYIFLYLSAPPPPGAQPCFRRRPRPPRPLLPSEIWPAFVAADAAFREERRPAAAALVRRCAPALPEVIRLMITELLLPSTAAFARAVFPPDAPPEEQPLCSWKIVGGSKLTFHGVVAITPERRVAYKKVISIKALNQLNCLCSTLVESIKPPPFKPIAQHQTKNVIVRFIDISLNRWYAKNK